MTTVFECIKDFPREGGVIRVGDRIKLTTDYVDGKCVMQSYDPAHYLHDRTVAPEAWTDFFKPLPPEAPEPVKHWWPKIGDRYFSIDWDDGVPYAQTRCVFDTTPSYGNCFKTAELAEAAIPRVKAALRNERTPLERELYAELKAIVLRWGFPNTEEWHKAKAPLDKYEQLEKEQWR